MVETRLFTDFQKELIKLPAMKNRRPLRDSMTRKKWPWGQEHVEYRNSKLIHLLKVVVQFKRGVIHVRKRPFHQYLAEKQYGRLCSVRKWNEIKQRNDPPWMANYTPKNALNLHGIVWLNCPPLPPIASYGVRTLIWQKLFTFMFSFLK